MKISDLMTAAGDPLELRGMWDEATRAALQELVGRTLSAAQRQFPDVHAQVGQTITGLYAHGFIVGRNHARHGLLLPGSIRLGLTGLTADELSAIVCPDDIRNL